MELPAELLGQTCHHVILVFLKGHVFCRTRALLGKIPGVDSQEEARRRNCKPWVGRVGAWVEVGGVVESGHDSARLSRAVLGVDDHVVVAATPTAALNLHDLMRCLAVLGGERYAL